VALASEAVAAAGEVGTLGIEGAEALIAAYPELLSGVAPAEIAGMTGSEFGAALASGALGPAAASPLVVAGVMALPAVAFAIGQVIANAEHAKQAEKAQTATATAQTYGFDPAFLAAALDTPGSYPEHEGALAIAMNMRRPSSTEILRWAQHAKSADSARKILQVALNLRLLSGEQIPTATLEEMAARGTPLTAQFPGGNMQGELIRRYGDVAQASTPGVVVHAPPPGEGTTPIVSYAPPSYGPTPDPPPPPPNTAWVPTDERGIEYMLVETHPELDFR
jgi:hypothetical protein